MFAPFVFQIAADAQRRIIGYLDGVQAQVAELKRLQTESAEVERLSGAVLARAGRLRQAVLKQAFEGRLVPQDPDDQSASVLLERIRKERERKEKKNAYTPNALTGDVEYSPELQVEDTTGK